VKLLDFQGQDCHLKLYLAGGSKDTLEKQTTKTDLSYEVA